MHALPFISTGVLYVLIIEEITFRSARKWPMLSSELHHTVITEKYMIMFIIYVQYIVTVSGKFQQYCSI